jgi:hypothetical protein
MRMNNPRIKATPYHKQRVTVVSVSEPELLFHFQIPCILTLHLRSLFQAAKMDISSSRDGHLKYMTLCSYSDSDLFGSATPVEFSEDLQLDFISILGLAQRLEIDFVPIRWPPALDPLGLGGQAEIRQLPINQQWSFAFKRMTFGVESDDVQIRVFHALASELMILGHP